MKLSKFEKEVLTYILKEDRADLVASLEDVCVQSRFNTGVGMVVDFEVGSAGPYDTYGDSVLGVRGDVPCEDIDPAESFSFQVAVTSNGLSNLEVWSNSDDWFPSNFDNIQLITVA